MLLETVLYIAIAVTIMLSGLQSYERAAEVARVNVAVRQLTAMTDGVSPSEAAAAFAVPAGSVMQVRWTFER